VADKKMEYVIETFSLTKVFTDWWGRNKVVAVDGLDLKIGTREIFGLLGPNGSGKTTTLKMLLSLLHPTKGKAVVLGGDSRDPKINCRIGFLPEESYLYPYLSAYETLDFYGRLFGLSAKIRKSRIEALLEMVGLSGMANRPVGTFSKGMARRIGLAQSLINDPELLILDEPTSGLDPIGTKQIKDLIVELGRRGKTVLLCSHLLADAEDVCDRIAIMYGGRIQRIGSVAELLKQTDKRRITTGPISDEVIGKIKAIVAAENLDSEVETPMERLESFFIDIVRQAREHKTPTSGVVTSGDLGDVEMAEAVSDVLDRLVTSSKDLRPEPLGSASVEPVKAVEIEPDEDLLKQLASSPEPVAPEKIDEKIAPQEAESQQDKVKKNILDELTGDREKGKGGGDENR